MGEGRRRKVKPGHIGAIAARYLRAEGCRVLKRGEGRFSATCPGCGGGTYEIDLGSGKAGCVEEGCAVPEGESWVGVVSYFEELDRKGDWDEIRRIGLKIIEEHEEALERKAQEERAERAERERAGREAETRRRAQETQKQERQGESHDGGKKELGRYVAQNEEERRLLHEHRAEQERLRRRKEEDEAEEALREEEVRREDQHVNASARAVAALAPVLGIELLLAVLAGAAVLMAAYYGVDWLGSSAEPNAEPAVFGAPAGGGDEAGWFGRLTDQVAAASAQLVPWRLPVGLLLGVLSGYLVGFFMGRGRRGRHAFSEDEYLAVCRPDERRGGRLVRVHLEADLSEISKEPLRRFAHGAGRAVGAVGEALAWVADALQMAEWPWFQIVARLLFGLLVGWLVFEYLPVSETTAVLAAVLVFLVGLVALMRDEW